MIPRDNDAKQFAIMGCKTFEHWPIDGSQFPYLGSLKEDDTIESIIRRLHKNAFDLGIDLGREQKENEIQRVLGIIKEEH
jgi:hypothetical protein